MVEKEIAMRKRFAIVNLAVALAVIAAFTVVAGSQVAAKTVHASKTTVTIAGWASTPAEPKDLQKVINNFQKANKNIKVKLVEYNGNTYPTTILSSISAGGGPDIFYVNSDKFLAWQEAGALYPLNSFIKKDKAYNYGDIYKSLRSGFTVKGKIYGIDKDYSTLAMEINTGIWKAAKMGKAPTNWSGFAADACKIRNYEKKHGHKDVYGAGLAPDQARWNPLLQSLGGHVLNKAQNKAEINSKAGVKAISLWASLVKKGCAAYPNAQQGWSGGEFGPGQAAMVWEGPWIIPYLQTTYPKLRYKIYPLPVNGNYLYTVAYSMNPHAKNKAAAWKLLSYLTGKVGEKQWVDLFKVLPARKSISAPAGDGVFLKGAKHAEAYLFRPRYTDPNGPYSILNNDLVKVAKGQMTAKQAVVDVTNAINHWLSTHP